MSELVVHGAAGEARYLIECVPSSRLEGANASELRGLGAPRPLDGLEKAGEAIAEVCDHLLGKVRAGVAEARPQELELTFGVSLTAEGGLPLIGKATGEATFEVRVLWQHESAGDETGK